MLIFFHPGCFQFTCCVSFLYLFCFILIYVYVNPNYLVDVTWRWALLCWVSEFPRTDVCSRTFLGGGETNKVRVLFYTPTILLPSHSHSIQVLPGFSPQACSLFFLFFFSFFVLFRFRQHPVHTHTHTHTHSHSHTHTHTVNVFNP